MYFLPCFLFTGGFTIVHALGSGPSLFSGCRIFVSQPRLMFRNAVTYEELYGNMPGILVFHFVASVVTSSLLLCLYKSDLQSANIHFYFAKLMPQIYRNAKDSLSTFKATKHLLSKYLLLGDFLNFITKNY